MKHLLTFARKLSSVHPEQGTRIIIKPNTYIYFVLLLFLIPAQWLLAWLIALSVHEFCHWAAVKISGGVIYELTVGIGGIKMQSSPLSDPKRFFCVLSGPIGGFFLVPARHWLPRTALCSWVLSIYNLLPFMFLDGGKALEILLGAPIAVVLEKMLLLLLSVAAIYAMFVLNLGILPVAVIAGLWLKSRKTPCKPRICKVQ